MSSAQIRLTESQVFLVGALEYERARARQRRATAREAANANANRNGTGAVGSRGDTPPQSPGPSSRRNSPDRDRERGRSVFHISASRAGSRSRPGSRAPSPGPLPSTSNRRLSEIAGNDDTFVPPNSRGRSASRTRAPSQQRSRGPRDDHTSVGRSGSLVRDSEPSLGSASTTTTPTTGAAADLPEVNSQLDEPPPALLRGLLTVTLSKPTRVKEISVRLKGSAKTDWPEGIGPRRLDVVEENILINFTHTFFSASNSSTTGRRATSVDPSTRSTRDESRGRAPARRAASVVPGRDSSHGRSYPHNSLSPNGLENPPPVQATVGLSQSSNVLSRISSNDSAGTSIPPPVRPGEAAPAYEAVPSTPSSPLHLPQTIEEVPNSEDMDLSVPPLSRPTPSTNSSYQRLRSPTPSRSPLGMSPSLLPSPSSSSLANVGDPHRMPRLARSSTRASHDSQASTSSEHTTHSHDAHPADRSNSSLASISSTSEHDRGRTRGDGGEDLSRSTAPDHLTVVTDNLARQSRSSLHSSTRPSPSPSGTTSPISSSTPRLPSALKSKGSSSRSGSHARFSLGGLTDALRGKSHSRARTPVDEGDQFHRPPLVPRRDSSPDVSRSLPSSRPSSIKGNSGGHQGSGGGRSLSRGRKTALKVLREALTTGHAHLHDQESGHGHLGETESAGFAIDDHEASSASPSEVTGDGWKEFKAGTYVYPISIPVPGTLPPTLSCEFGSVAYTLKATVVRAGALTTNLTAHSEVILVAMPGEDDTEESESIVVERFWETQMKYHVALSGKSFPIGGQIPLTIRLSPLAKVKVFRISAQLEQKTSYYASVNSGRKLTRHETPRKVMLIRVDHKDSEEPMLPILSDDQNVLLDHPLREWFINATSSDDTTPSLLDPNGPWHLEHDLQLPDCSSKINFSTHHEKANMAISHVLKIMIRVERGDDEFLDAKGKRKRWDIVVETPVHLLSCRCAQNLLPAYTASTATLSSGPGGQTPTRGNASSSSSSGGGPASIITRALRTATGTGHHNSSPHEFTCGGGAAGGVGGMAGSHASSGGHALHARSNHGGLGVGGAGGIGATAIHRPSGSNHHSAPPVASLEQNLLFARLISGETTPNGETPPTYQEVSAFGPSAPLPPSAVPTEVQSRPPSRARSSGVVVVDDDDEDHRRGRSRARGNQV